MLRIKEDMNDPESVTQLRTIDLIHRGQPAPHTLARIIRTLLAIAAFIVMVGAVVGIALNTASYNSRTVQVLRDLQNWSALLSPSNNAATTVAGITLVDQEENPPEGRKESAKKTFALVL
ncbi:hypothetical protein HPB47_005439 [Ixodes persulcatus]|uniref:Uncharacterized protein n=1 Tax=Ixodes persulcatus TaxID=34615 RepID=A0AC60PDD5_IXOPE|nr:hypothetical protein HPB47_005439 [Ixodes persulcatus]